MRPRLWFQRQVMILVGFLLDRVRRLGHRVSGLLRALRSLPVEFHFFATIPAAPRQLRQLLKDDPLVYPFQFPLARIIAVLREESNAEDASGTRLHFQVNARSPFGARLALRFHARKIERELEHLANHLYFRCLAAPLAPPGLDPALLLIADFPSLDRRNFRQPGARARERKNRLLRSLDAPASYPARDYFFHYLVQPGYPQKLDLAEVLLVPLAIPARELSALLPPPFRLASAAPPTLLLIIARETGLRKGRGGVRLDSVRWELRAPVQLLSRSRTLHGWLPLVAGRVPIDRPVFPWDGVSASLRRYPEGLRFCAGDARRQLLYHCVYRPLRTLRAGDVLSPFFSGEQRIFVQSPASLDITVFAEKPDFAVNRLEIALDETPTWEHHHRSGNLPGPAAYYGDQLGVSLGLPTEALYLARLSIELSHDCEIPLREANYRAFPACVGEPVY